LGGANQGVWNEMAFPWNGFPLSLERKGAKQSKEWHFSFQRRRFPIQKMDESP
jgi:hypothetical protein